MNNIINDIVNNNINDIVNKKDNQFNILYNYFKNNIDNSSITNFKNNIDNSLITKFKFNEMKNLISEISQNYDLFMNSNIINIKYNFIDLNYISPIEAIIVLRKLFYRLFKEKKNIHENENKLYNFSNKICNYIYYYENNISIKQNIVDFDYIDIYTTDTKNIVDYNLTLDNYLSYYIKNCYNDYIYNLYNILKNKNINVINNKPIYIEIYNNLNITKSKNLQFKDNNYYYIFGPTYIYVEKILVFYDLFQIGRIDNNNIKNSDIEILKDNIYVNIDTLLINYKKSEKVYY